MCLRIANLGKKKKKTIHVCVVTVVCVHHGFFQVGITGGHALHAPLIAGGHATIFYRFILALKQAVPKKKGGGVRFSEMVH